MGSDDTRALAPDLAAFSVALLAEDDADGAVWAELWPASEDGVVRGRDGREFQQGELAEIIKLTELPLLLDVDHESEFFGSTAASGWFEELAIRNDSVWGRLETTPKGAPLVEQKIFRMLSPVVRLAFDAPEKDGDPDPLPRAIGFSSVALTNRPNLRMTALNRAETAANATEEPMTDEELAELRALLGLEEDADGAMLLEAVKALASDDSDDEGDADAPTPDENAENARLSGEVATLRASLAIVTEQRDTLAAHAADARKGDAKARVDLAIREGKANPAHRATLEKLAGGGEADQALFSDLTSTVTGPPVGRVVDAEPAPKTGGFKARLSALSDAQRHQYQNFRGLGWSQEKALNKLEGEG